MQIFIKFDKTGLDLTINFYQITVTFMQKCFRYGALILFSTWQMIFLTLPLFHVFREEEEAWCPGPPGVLLTASKKGPGLFDERKNPVKKVV